MKLSDVSKERLSAMTPEQKWEFNCGGICDDGKSGEVALLLGGRPWRAVERALAAAELYRQGRVKYIVPSGGVTWEYEGETISECDLMTRILCREGVPEEAIWRENEATTTRENMMYGAIVINRKTKFYTVDHIVIVTSQSHMKRSLALAKAYLPRKVTVSAYPSYPAQSKEEWLADEENLKLLDSAIDLMKGLVDHGVIEDMEIAL